MSITAIPNPSAINSRAIQRFLFATNRRVIDAILRLSPLPSMLKQDAVLNWYTEDANKYLILHLWGSNMTKHGYIKFLGTAGGRFVVAKQLRSSAGTFISAKGKNVIVDPGPGTLVRSAASRPRIDVSKLEQSFLRMPIWTTQTMSMCLLMQ